MKKRVGFISNSSTTSFIVAIKKDVCKHCGRSAINLEREIEILHDKVSEDYEVRAKGKKDILAHLGDWYYSKDEVKRIKGEIKDIDEAEYDLLYVTASLHDEELIERLVKSKDVKVISRESE